jgi:anti-anti-sigma factor
MSNIGKNDGSNLEVRITSGPERVVLHPVGPINSVNAESFKSKLLSAVAQSEMPVELDLEEVPYASSAAFRAMLAAIDGLSQRGQKLRLTHCSSTVLRAIDIINFAMLVDTRK